MKITITKSLKRGIDFSSESSTNLCAISRKLTGTTNETDQGIFTVHSTPVRIDALEYDEVTFCCGQARKTFQFPHLVVSGTVEILADRLKARINEVRSFVTECEKESSITFEV